MWKKFKLLSKDNWWISVMATMIKFGNLKNQSISINLTQNFVILNITKFLLFLNPVCNFCDWWEHQKQRVKKMAPSFTQRYNARSIASLCWNSTSCFNKPFADIFVIEKITQSGCEPFWTKSSDQVQGCVFFLDCGEHHRVSRTMLQISETRLC